MQQPNLKVMSRQVHQLAVRYHQAKIKVMMYQSTQDAHEEALYHHHVKFIDTFHYLLESMIPENRQIIVNDYLEKQPEGWWLEVYPRSTYYRLKGKALKELLTYLS
jgi:hypothetical protein